MARTARKAAHETLLMALACGATIELAAQKAGLSERTAYRKLADPSFYKQVQQRRTELVQRTIGMLTGAGLGSVKTLVDLQQDASIPPAVRRSAARDVLHMGLRFAERAELEQRLDALEERVMRPTSEAPPKP
jgi:hypothetical protein